MRALRRPLLLPLAALLAPLALTGAACSTASEPTTGDATLGSRPEGGRAVPGLDVEVLADGLDHPWDIRSIGGGRLLFTERSRATLSVWEDGDVRRVDFPSESVWVSGETGLLGLEVDPQVRRNGRFWTCQGATTKDGGHDAIHPDLGTMADFDAFVARAGELGLEVALDLALQAAPDHPWVTTHPQFFTTRADGSIAYAENPPKKYQDIYPLNFDNDPSGICREVLRVVKLWMSHGVRIFRVDNPHTKPVAFWEWLLKEVRRTDPDVLFLSEAFTRPAMMHGLGAVGFHQSYTYFTWRTAKWEIEEYLRELSSESDHLMRPNFFVNTPDILHAYLQYGGPAAFKVRAALAATSSPSWGVYAGYELFEHVAVKPGSEEYLDSEKYQIRIRDWEAAEAEGRTLTPYLTRLNELRREHRSLQLLRNLTIHHSDDENVLVFAKQAVVGDPDSDTVVVVINLDPHATRETTVHLDLPSLGMDWGERFVVHDEITHQDWSWGQHNYVRLDPHHEPAHVLTVRRGA